MESFDPKRLKAWFALHRRSLPWRENTSPYAVWISEVMLQQTQVQVVIPYFERWMQSFPSISALAHAPLKRVIKAWEGLGYYSRARHLHLGAQYVTEHYGGILPDSATALHKVKGIGPYTVGAILSFAFKKKAAAVDGNVLRVLSRFFCIEAQIDQPKVKREIEALTAALLPDEEPWLVMEALIELGALVCKKKPLCTRCPLQPHCLAYKRGKTDRLPNKRKRAKTTHLHRLVAVIRSGDALLIRKTDPGEVMADLVEFPYFAIDADVEQELSIPLTPIAPLPKVTHGFTRYKAFLYPYFYKAQHQAHISHRAPGKFETSISPIDPTSSLEKVYTPFLRKDVEFSKKQAVQPSRKAGEKSGLELENYEWASLEEIETLSFSSGHRRILHSLAQVHHL